MPRKPSDDKAVFAAPPPRRGKGFAAAAEPARKPLSRTVENFGFADPQVLTRWREIVGEDLAARCRPTKVLYGKGRDLAARLLVAADGAAALEVEYRAPQIIERVNAVYGYRHISRLSITQAGAAPGMAEEAEAFDHARPAVRRGEPTAALSATVAAARAAERAAGPVQDDKLRAALGRLGAYVLSHPRNDETEISGESAGDENTPATR